MNSIKSLKSKKPSVAKEVVVGGNGPNRYGAPPMLIDDPSPISHDGEAKQNNASVLPKIHRDSQDEYEYNVGGGAIS